MEIIYCMSIPLISYASPATHPHFFNSITILLHNVSGYGIRYVLTTMTAMTIKSNNTRNANPQDAPYFEFSFNHCTLVQYSLGSMSEFNRIRLKIKRLAPTI